MPVIRLRDVQLGYDGREPVLDHVELHLTTGWTGIVGPNGAGKTTLVRAAIGELSPSSGEIAIDPTPARVELCEQRVDEPSASIVSFSSATDRTGMRWMRRLGLDPFQIDRWQTLSAGERKRWQLATALAAEPDVLALDEPTNHLDGEVRAVVLEALRRFRGIGLVVSHDRVLLDEITTKTVRVDARTVVLHEGSYSLARDRWEADARARREERATADSERKRAARLLGDARRVESSASRSVSATSRIKGPRDADGRSMGAKNLASWAAAKAGRVVARRRRDLHEAEAARSAIPIERERGRALFLGWEPPPGKWLATLDGVDLRAGAKLVARDVRVAIARDARIHVAGRNGSGKSTLLAALVRAASVPSERLLYVPQELGANEGFVIAREIAALPPDVRGRVGQLVAALGLDPSRALASGMPSPGEVRKLAIALGLARRVCWVVLDEPTNHLDLSSIERLEAALSDYPGALVLASHDARFAERITRERWHMDHGTIETAERRDS